MSALIFVRDGRTLAYIPVTTAALDAIRAVCKASRDDGRKRSYPHALAVYMALLELANEDRTDRVAITHADIGERAGCSRATAQLATYDLVAGGLLVVRENTHGRGRNENEYVVVEPGETGTQDVAPPHARNADPARQKCSPRERGPSPSTKAQVFVEENSEEGACAKPTTDVEVVFGKWVEATSRDPARTQPTPDRCRRIKAALKSHGLDDCLAAVTNIGQDAWAAGHNDRGTPFNDISHALGGTERIEKWRDWKPPATTAAGDNVHPLRSRQSKPRMANAGNLDRFNDSEW